MRYFIAIFGVAQLFVQWRRSYNVCFFSKVVVIARLFFLPPRRNDKQRPVASVVLAFPPFPPKPVACCMTHFVQRRGY